MAFRTIETDIWGNAFFDGMKTAHKLLYIYLFSNQFITNIGVLEVTKARMAYETGTSVKVVNEFLAAMETRGQIVMDGELILVVKFIAKQTRFGSDAETNKNDKLLKNLTRLFCACPSRKIRRVLSSTYPNLFAGLETPSNKEGSHFAPEDKGLVSETEAPSFGEASPFLSEDKGLVSDTEGVGGDIGDIGDDGEVFLSPPSPPTGGRRARAHAREGVSQERALLPDCEELPMPEEIPKTPPQAEPPAESEKAKPKMPKRRQADFVAWYAAYPRKKNRDDAVRAWDSACKDKRLPDLQTLLDALEWQRKQPDWVKAGGQYAPYPASYLNKGSWQDEKPAPVRPSYAPDERGRTRYVREDEMDFDSTPMTPNGEIDWLAVIARNKEAQHV